MKNIRNYLIKYLCIMLAVVLPASVLQFNVYADEVNDYETIIYNGGTYNDYKQYENNGTNYKLIVNANISENVFGPGKNFYNIKAIEINAGINVGVRSFEGHDSSHPYHFDYVKLNGNSTFTKNDYWYAFANCIIDSIDISNCTVISNNTFRGAIFNFDTLVIPSNIQTIDRDAFNAYDYMNSGNKSLNLVNKVVIEDGNTQISLHAACFANIPKLNYIYIGRMINELHNYGFFYGGTDASVDTIYDIHGPFHITPGLFNGINLKNDSSIHFNLYYYGDTLSDSTNCYSRFSNISNVLHLYGYDIDYFESFVPNFIFTKNGGQVVYEGEPPITSLNINKYINDIESENIITDPESSFGWGDDIYINGVLIGDNQIFQQLRVFLGDELINTYNRIPTSDDPIVINTAYLTLEGYEPDDISIYAYTVNPVYPDNPIDPIDPLEGGSSGVEDVPEIEGTDLNDWIQNLIDSANSASDKLNSFVDDFNSKYLDNLGTPIASYLTAFNNGYFDGEQSFLGITKFGYASIIDSSIDNIPVINFLFNAFCGVSALIVLLGGFI